MFYIVFLLRAGVAAPLVFVAVAGILLLRFVLRPLVLVLAPRIGARRTLMLGTAISVLQFPAMAQVRGPDLALVLFCVVAALGGVVYWTCYHAFFAALGDMDQRGSQVGLRQALVAVAGVLGPAAGGIALATLGPWAAFGLAGVIEAAAIWPVRALPEPRVARVAPPGAYAAARAGARLFFTDGWITCIGNVGWDMIAFPALGASYEAFGGTLAAAALAAAVSGMALGRFIDRGHARHALGLNAAVLAGTFVLKSLCSGDAALVVFATTASTLLGGFYIPTLMTAIYNDAQASPCALRFQFVTEAGWDFGGAAAALLAAALVALHVALPLVILAALPAVALQARLLAGRYSSIVSTPSRIS